MCLWAYRVLSPEHDVGEAAGIIVQIHRGCNRVCREVLGCAMFYVAVGQCESASVCDRVVCVILARDISYGVAGCVRQAKAREFANVWIDGLYGI